jgi:hypothetical protein
VLNSNDTIDGATVRHEMLHALLQSGAHPRSAFLQSCGGVVPCPDQCVREAGAPPTPDAATPRVSPSELEVTSAVSPDVPSSAIDGGLATFTISVRNPFTHPVVVLLPSNPIGGPALSYTYDIRLNNGGNVASKEVAFDIGVTYFAADETKRDVIDFIVIPVPTPSFGAVFGIGINGIALPPGSYVFRGDYGGQFAPDLNLGLSP